jgi:hypothetical protein
MNETTTLANTVKTSGEMAGAASASHAKALVEAKYVMAVQRPRNLLSVRDKILEACARPGFAASAWYAKPVGGGKVRGPSIRFAETAIQCMTNISVMPSIVYEDREKLVLDVQVIDLESNTSYGDQVTMTKTVERKDGKGREIIGERTNTNGEKVFIVMATEDEMANKTNSAKSKIIRNSGLRLIPQDIIEEAEWCVRETIAKGGGDPAQERKRMADDFSFIGIKPAELEKYLGHTLDSISPAELADLREVFATLKDGEAKWSDYVEKGVKRAGTTTSVKAQPLEQVAIVEAESAPVAAVDTTPAMEDNPQLLDLLDSIELSNTCEELNTCKVKCAEIEHEAHRELAKKSVVKKAKDLQLVWDKSTHQYKAA